MCFLLSRCFFFFFLSCLICHIHNHSFTHYMVLIRPKYAQYSKSVHWYWYIEYTFVYFKLLSTHTHTETKPLMLSRFVCKQANKNIGQIICYAGYVSQSNLEKTLCAVHTHTHHSIQSLCKKQARNNIFYIRNTIDRCVIHLFNFSSTSHCTLHKCNKFRKINSIEYVFYFI